MNNTTKQKAKELLERISPWPWEFKQQYVSTPNGGHIINGEELIICRLTQAADKSLDQKQSDAEFIAEAPSIIQALLDENEKLQVDNTNLKTLLGETGDYIKYNEPNLLHVAETKKLWVEVRKVLLTKIQAVIE